ncbi:hypothetical protein P153DRAFT_400913 [Dothidotthia symphoricarpi CBS 119687]|uniref:Uncharacterized protein n=1 Tax=Dothidotthia symphoricarpi CBS 119687 TaxID=1392245 RepID=A0A6A6A2N9_9PLEO|nr:uncharacterized protein P153DRAFT_400913 [Dothidotthia symphoricarpi CBS 119687]KAF2124841.1 hypothetical protein P153DRAFT_400913 [Dothidotthia symphoricarpi CBS 119687]
MVATRRSAATNVSTMSGHLKPKVKKIDNDTIHVVRPNDQAHDDVPTTPVSKSSCTTLEDDPGTISGHDLSITSPSTGETPEIPISSKLPPLQRASEIPYPSIETLIPHLQPWAIKPTGSQGSAKNPIVVIEDSPPSRLAVRRKRKRQTEPHKFMDRHSKLYTYRPSNPAPVPKPANGSTFTGHRSHDIYRMMNAKLTSMGWEGKPVYGQDVPYEAHVHAQYMAQQHGTPYTHHSQRPPANLHPFPQSSKDPYTTSHTPSVPHSTPQPPSETVLRHEAVRYIQEHTSSRPEQTSLPNSESTLITRSPQHPSKFKLDTDLALLTHQSLLLAQLFESYPHSTDQTRVREAIGMLVTVQNQRFEQWMDSEAPREAKHTRTVSASSVLSRPQVTQEMRGREQKDEEMRGVLSARAGLWQDGSGLGVADVYALEVEGEVSPREVVAMGGDEDVEVRFWEVGGQE